MAATLNQSSIVVMNSLLFFVCYLQSLLVMETVLLLSCLLFMISSELAFSCWWLIMRHFLLGELFAKVFNRLQINVTKYWVKEVRCWKSYFVYQFLKLYWISYSVTTSLCIFSCGVWLLACLFIIIYFLPKEFVYNLFLRFETRNRNTVVLEYIEILYSQQNYDLIVITYHQIVANSELPNYSVTFPNGKGRLRWIMF